MRKIKWLKGEEYLNESKKIMQRKNIAAAEMFLKSKENICLKYFIN